MTKNTNRWLWFLLAVALVVGALWQFYPLPDASQRMHAVPLFGKAFLGRNLPLNDWEKATFKNVGVMKRLYQVGDQNLFITALDGTHNRHLVHDPYYCLRGAGWELSSATPVALPQGEAMLLWITKGDLTQQAMYWFTDGDRQYTSPWRYWWQATLRRLTLGRSGPEPVLVVIQPIGAKTLDYKALFEKFPDLLKF